MSNFARLIPSCALALAAGLLSPVGPPLSSAATAATAPIPSDVAWLRSRTSLLGQHAWYQQQYQGLPVLDAYYARHILSSGDVKIYDGRMAVTANLSTQAKISPNKATVDSLSQAQTTAKRAGRSPLTEVTTSATLAVQGGTASALVWQVIASGAAGVEETRVDARTGRILSQRDLAHRATGEGQVFAPNPAVTLGREDLQDDNDQDSAVFGPAYRRVPLNYLTDPNILRGKYAWITNKGVATSSNGEYFYTRSDGRFEQVMGYWGVTSAQEYLQSLGFVDVNNEAQRLSINTTAEDNSFYNPSTDSIQLGRGGVDDGEDAEIVWHELGHAIQNDQIPSLNPTGQTGAIGEGFGDYWAMTNSSQFNNGVGLACVGEWDSTAYTPAPHCLRRLDGNKTTADLVDQVHADGEIWSRALFDIYRGLDRKRADTLIIEAQFQFTPDISFSAAAKIIIKTAQELYGDSAAAICRSAFSDRKIAV